MDYKVVWTDPAIENLKNIVTYISEDNPTAAKNIGLGIYEHVNILSSFPFITPIYAKSSEGEIRQIIFKRYRIFYRVRSDKPFVDILHVRDSSMDDPDIEKDITSQWT